MRAGPDDASGADLEAGLGADLVTVSVADLEAGLEAGLGAAIGAEVESRLFTGA